MSSPRRILLLVALAAALVANPADAVGAGFDLLPGAAGFDVSAVNADATPAKLANSHPFALTATIGFAPGGEDVRDIYLELPPGLFENPSSVPKCTQSQFQTPRSSPFETSHSGESCPDASQVGVVSIHTPGDTRSFGVFNLSPGPGLPSELGAAPFGAPVVFTPSIREVGGEYGITLASREFTQAFHLEGMELTLWGAPWATAHDGQRGDCLNEAAPAAPFGSCPPAFAEKESRSGLYLTMPTTCAAPPAFELRADSWPQPEVATAGAAAATGTLEGCDQLGQVALASALPTSALASSPTGFDIQLSPSQAGIKKAVFALPEGMTINPAVGAGLAPCTESQYAAESAFSPPGAACPSASKVGVVTLETPLLEEPLQGGMFIATPYENPFGSAYALYFVAKAPERGFIVKIAGRLDADPGSGRLLVSFETLPRLPYSNLKLSFRAGQRAPLVTPATCGSYFTRITLSSWTDPASSTSQASNFKLLSGPGGGPCPSDEAFAPQATAGSVNSRAGAATSFYLHLTRTDAEQEITSYSAQLPPGLLGAIAGIPYCPDAAIAAARGRSGFAEAAAPSCPAASQIGHTYSGFGVGLAPAYAPGSLYLAGPFHGAPLSVVAIDPAVVGPFDLGTIVIRSAIQVDPHSAQVTIDSSASDPIPHIFAGIPLRLRDVRLYVDRPGFMVNPTNCERRQIASTLTGSQAPFVNPRSATATATAPFQAFDCSSMGFEPALSLAVKGPPRRGGYQQLRVTVTPRPGDANISSAAVTLPPSLFLAQNHIRAICARGQSASDSCPAGAIVGSAEARTPLLSDPMAGPVYLRSSDNALPDLVTVLHGTGGLRIVLECRIDTYRSGLRGRCEGLPDAPVTRFTMTIFGGRKRGILQSAANLCSSPKEGIARLIGQADLGLATKPRLAVRCPKHKRKHPRRGKHRGRGR
jgi:hypothetical protein